MQLFILYVAVWFLPLTSGIWYISDINVELSDLATNYMFGLIVIMGFISVLFSIISNNKPPKSVIIARFSESKSIKFHKNCLKIWFFIFVVEIVSSGGAPIIWGTEKNYGDFGIPVIHGFSNMLRAMIFSHLILFSCLNFKLSKQLIIFSLLPLISSLVIEQSRGAFVMTICFALGPMLIFSKFSLKKIFKFLIVLPLIVIVLSVYQFLRHAESSINELFIILEFVVDSGTAYEKLLLPVANYIATPALNAGLTIDTMPLINFELNQSIKGLIPSPIRALISDSEQEDYGILVSEAFNTSTFITPFVKDFGIFGSVIFFTVFFLVCTYVYQKAKYGSVLNIVILPPLVMCLTLSFFTSYVTSLITIIYILVGIPVSKKLKYLPKIK